MGKLKIRVRQVDDEAFFEVSHFNVTAVIHATINESGNLTLTGWTHRMGEPDNKLACDGLAVYPIDPGTIVVAVC